MRRLRDKQGSDQDSKFYLDIKEIHSKKEYLCNEDFCKQIFFGHAKTIEGDNEGFYAWKTLQHRNNHFDDNCHITFDLGGETAQITQENSVYSEYLGKGRTKENIGNDKIESCYSYLKSYDGLVCRNNIKEYIDANFKNLPNLAESICKIYGISNFYSYFNDVCDMYMPYMEAVSSNIVKICQAKQSNSIELKVIDYKEISDEICQYWNPQWAGVKGEFAKYTCFAGNYNYQLLKAAGMSDYDSIFPDESDWALGAAYMLHS